MISTGARVAQIACSVVRREVRAGLLAAARHSVLLLRCRPVAAVVCYLVTARIGYADRPDPHLRHQQLLVDIRGQGR